MLARDGHKVCLYERFDGPRTLGSGLIVQPTGLTVREGRSLGPGRSRHALRMAEARGRPRPWSPSRRPVRNPPPRRRRRGDIRPYRPDRRRPGRGAAELRRRRARAAPRAPLSGALGPLHPRLPVREPDPPLGPRPHRAALRPPLAGDPDPGRDGRGHVREPAGAAGAVAPSDEFLPELARGGAARSAVEGHGAIVSSPLFWSHPGWGDSGGKPWRTRRKIRSRSH
ncbi:MAG TPA: hypothetical protein VGB04_10815 [Allosphingosinicella sp.]